MLKKISHITGVILILLVLVGQTFSAPSASAAQDNGFVQRNGNTLRLDSKQFRFAGSSNYYLMYKSPFMVDDVLNAAASNNFRVMRIWGSLDIGDPNDPSTSLRGPADGVYFQYWDPLAGAPAYNDGATGLEHLDYVVYKAGQLGIKLVIPFVNNWNDFGGMDQYVRWRDISTPPDQTWYHDSFYTDPVIRQWYKDWIAHLLNRVNLYNGIAYKDDPTIMTWELGNEPRCLSAGAYGRSSNCTTQTLIDWVSEMSTYIKSVDSNHLVSVGDEGFYCLANPTHWTENCGEGVDTVAFSQLPNIDVMSVHLYPEYWGTTVAWGTEWIKRHIQDAKAIGKAVMLGEFGIKDQSIRNVVYKEWTEAAFVSGGQSGADGALYWILSGKQDGGSLYPDYDGFTVYAGTPVFITLGNFAQKMAANRDLNFPPVADHDNAVTEFNTPVTLNPPANDIAYGKAALNLASIDLDPLAAGQQTSIAVAGGTFQAYPDGKVTFTPADGFAGKTTASYVIQDSSAQTSNAAVLTVTVKPAPSMPILLASYETGLDGAAILGWGGAGTITQTTAFATNGTHSIEITVTGEGWFQVWSAAPANISQKTAVRLDLQTLASQTYRKLAIQVGDGWTWCEQNGGDGNTPQNTVATISLDLTNMTCGGADLTKLQVVHIYLQPGTYRIDYVRAE